MGNNPKYFTIGTVILGVMAAATLLAFSEDWDATWRITPSLSVNKVHLTLRHNNGFGNWVNSRDVPLDSFRGLSLSMLASPGPAKFEYVADAGRLLCEGRFLVGTGSGTYTFSADPAFVTALQQMGYDAPDDEQLFSMLMMDIHREFAREIRDSGLRASSQDLVALKAHGVTPEYLKGLKDAGYDDLRAEEVDQLRVHGVDGAYLKRLQDAGMRHLNAEQIAKLRMHGVD